MPVMGRALALIALLLGPLAAAEWWAQGSIDRLFPHLEGADRWSDTKRLLLERAGCPEILAIGSSMTNRSIVAELVAGETLAFAGHERPVESVFTFGLEGQRAALMYAIWRHVRGAGCVPPYLLVEANPTVLNGSPGPRQHWAPYLSPATFARLPRGFTREMGLGARDLLEHWTWERLLVFRQRGPITASLWNGAPEARRALPLDGTLKPLFERDLEGRRFAAEAERRARRPLPYAVSTVQQSSLRALIEQARTAGSRVIVHTPPVTSIYRDRIVALGGSEAWCRFARGLRDDPEVEYFDGYGGLGFKHRNFFDWVHLNRIGAKHYTSLLFRSLRGERDFPATSTDVCDGSET